MDQDPSPVSPVSPHPEQSLDLWYQDGTVILQAGSKRFRVYRGILSGHSPVFNDMFAIPQPQSTEEVDGCPLVHMQDSAADLYYFLRTLHDAGFFNENTSDFAVVSGVLRLSAKYEVAYFKRQAYRTLAPLFPTTLREWDQLHPDNSQNHLDGSSRPFAVVKLFRDTGLTALLPVAMCSACFTPGGVGDILNGVSKPDGSHDELDAEDKSLCLKAREKLLLAQRELLPGCLLFLPTACASRDKCNFARIRSLRDWAHSQAVRETPPHTFRIGLDSMEAFRIIACTSCRDIMDADFEITRHKLWDELPTLFGLPNWAELLRSSQLDAFL